MASKSSRSFSLLTPVFVDHNFHQSQKASLTYLKYTLNVKLTGGTIEEPNLIAALFVETDGIYFNDPRIIPYDINRDAFTYKGPNPVIAHPPCKRWGRYWSGGPSAKVRRLKGDDDNAFAYSLWCVRTFGGVIEHPEASIAWPWFGLNKPPKSGGWVVADAFGGVIEHIKPHGYI